jgi:hypothetical protein
MKIKITFLSFLFLSIFFFVANAQQNTGGNTCWMSRDSSWQVVPLTGTACNGCPGIPPYYRNDDSYTNPAIALPFSFCVNGQSRNACYINNNGSITLGTPFATFTPMAFPNLVFPEMIAGFFADADTRNALSGVVYHQLTSTHLAVQWDSIGYYNQHADKFNSFQIIITDGTDTLLSSPYNVGFCYRDMSWTTGDASGGVNGFEGSPATVGLNFGDGVNFIQVGLFDTSGTAYYGSQAADITAPFSGVDWLDYQHFEFDWCTPIGIEEISASAGFNIYPNPSHSGSFTVSLKKQNASQNSELEILDITGRIVYQHKLNDKLSAVNCHLNPGSYLVKIRNSEQQFAQMLLVQ